MPGRRPQSFGRAESEGQPVEDMTIRGGESLHLVLHLDVTPTPESLEALQAAVAAATRAGVLDGYAAALADMDAEDQPGGGLGGARPGSGDQGVSGGG